MRLQLENVTAVPLLLLLLALATLGSAIRAHASAYTLAPKTWQILSVGSFIVGEQTFDRKGRPRPTAPFGKADWPLVVEYGVRDDLTLIFAPKLLAARQGGALPDSFGGFGGLSVGARARLWRSDDGAGLVSVQGLTEFASVADSTVPLSAGDRDNELDLRLLLARSFAIRVAERSWPAFVNAELAYRHRSGPPPDELHLDLTFGMRIAPQWLLLAQSFNVWSLGPGYAGFPATRYSKAQLSLAYDINAEWSLQIGMLMTIAGLNAWREQGLVAGLWRRF